MNNGYHKTVHLLFQSTLSTTYLVPEKHRLSCIGRKVKISSIWSGLFLHRGNAVPLTFYPQSMLKCPQEMRSDVDENFIELLKLSTLCWIQFCFHNYLNIECLCSFRYNAAEDLQKLQTKKKILWTEKNKFPYFLEGCRSVKNIVDHRAPASNVQWNVGVLKFMMIFVM